MCKNFTNHDTNYLCAVEQDTIDCEYLAYFEANIYINKILCNFLVRNLCTIFLKKKNAFFAHENIKK